VELFSFFFFSISSHCCAFLAIILLLVDVSSPRLMFLGETNHDSASSSETEKSSVLATRFNQSGASGVKNKDPASLTKPQDDNNGLLELTTTLPMQQHSKKGTSLDSISTSTDEAVDENNLKHSEANYEVSGIELPPQCVGR
jgi:hypothetical protein